MLKSHLEPTLFAKIATKNVEPSTLSIAALHRYYNRADRKTNQLLLRQLHAPAKSQIDPIDNLFYTTHLLTEVSWYYLSLATAQSYGYPTNLTHFFSKNSK
jgi:hypothetical protein